MFRVITNIVLCQVVMCPPPKPSPGAFVSQLKSRDAIINWSFFKKSEVYRNFVCLVKRLVMSVWCIKLWSRLYTMIFSVNSVCIVLGFMYNCLLKYPDFLNYKSIPSLSSSSSMKSMSSSLQAWFEMITFSREIERKPGLK